MPLGKLGKIGVGWTALVIIGVSGFIASKASVDKNRYESMKVRERMRKANVDGYTIEQTKRFDI